MGASGAQDRLAAAFCYRAVLQYSDHRAEDSLHESGALSAQDDIYQRGIAFLLKTQEDDGSWHIRTRAKPFQTYFESGFPHGEDQFISYTGSGWATMALLLALPPATK